MTYINLDESATVSWSNHVLFGDIHDGIGESRHFEHLRDAVTFAVTELPEHFRGNAWVMTSSHTYKPDEIAALYENVQTYGGAGADDAPRAKGGAFKPSGGV